MKNMKNAEIGRFGYLFIITLIGLSLYWAYEAMTTGEYKVSGSGPSSAGASMINFIGETTGPIGVAVLYVVFASLIGAATIFITKQSKRR